MNTDLSIFEPFAKGRQKQAFRGNNAVIYTRVSTKEQAENNMSLETQRKACELYALKCGYSILNYFGGTYESAKSDERKEFNNMLAFVKKSRVQISYIIVYSVDRFSRSGPNAIFIAEQLKKQGILVVSVSQPTDVTTSSGSLQQNIQFIFSEYDNQLRREKSMAGVKEALLRGEWCHNAPTGYDIIRVNGKRQIVVNETGKLLRKAFIWKAQENISNEEAIIRLAKLGLKVTHQRISQILRNPFYCGLISHNMLEGKLLPGNHEALISKELFLTVNGIQNKNAHGYTICEENNEIPLKRFVKCDECGFYMRGYMVQKKKIHYYKCNTKGCNNNKSAKDLNNAFKDILQVFNSPLSLDLEKLLTSQMIATYNQLTEGQKETRTLLMNQQREIAKKMERLEERYIEEELTKDLYIKYFEKYKEEKNEIDKSLNQPENEVSNLELCIEKAISISSNLASTWSSANYSTKQKIQFLLFPEGIRYNKKNNICRTNRINSVFGYISQLNWDSSKQKSGISTVKFDYSALVGPLGIEPSTY